MMKKDSKRPYRMAKKIGLFIMFFWFVSTIVSAAEPILFELRSLNIYGVITFTGNGVGKGREFAANMRNSKLLSGGYTDVSHDKDNAYVISEIVKRQVIRKGDVYTVFYWYYGPYIGNSFVEVGGIVEFTSETKYECWFYKHRNTYEGLQYGKNY